MTVGRDTSLSWYGLTFLLALMGCFALTACGGSLRQMAQDNLYQTENANNTEVPEAPDGYSSKLLQVTHEGHQYQIHTWSYAQNYPAPVIVYFHGNAINIGGLFESGFLEMMEKLRAHFVVIDFPGYGRSTGKSSQGSVTAAGKAALQWTEQSFPGEPVILWGRSLGAAVAVQLARKNEKRVDRFILTSPWTDILSLAKYHFGSLAEQIPEDWLSSNSWDSLGAAKKVEQPGLIHHGTKDETIPFSFGKTLKKGFPEGAVTFHPVKGRKHNDLFLEKKVWREIKDFIW